MTTPTDHAQQLFLRCVDLVCRKMGVTLEDIARGQKTPRIVRAREMLVVMLRHPPHAKPPSYPQIARCLGRTSHSTCIQMYRRGIIWCDHKACWS